MSGANNVNDEYIVIFRYKTHGNRFELLCRRQETEKLLTEDGRLLHATIDDDSVLARILQKPTVYSNAKRKEIATKSSLNEAFGSDTTVRETLLQILTKGDILETQRDRDMSKNHVEMVKEEIINLLPRMLLNPFSGVNPEPFDVKEAIGSVLGRWKPSPFGVPMVVEAGYVASQIAHKIDCVRVLKMIVFTYNKTRCSRQQIVSWHDFLIGYASVVSSVDSFTVPAPPSLPSTAGDEKADGEEVKHTSQNEFHVKEILIVDAALIDVDDYWKRLCSTFAVSVEQVAITDDEVRQFSNTLFDQPNVVCVGWEDDEHPHHSAGAKYHHASDTPSDINSRNMKQREVYDKNPDSIAAVVLNRNIGSEDASSHRKKKRGGKSRKGGSDDEGSDSDNKHATKASSRASDLEQEYMKKTHKVLQDLCKKNGMSTGGKKEDLVDRLVAFEMNK